MKTQEQLILGALEYALSESGLGMKSKTMIRAEHRALFIQEKVKDFRKAGHDESVAKRLAKLAYKNRWKELTQ